MHEAQRSETSQILVDLGCGHGDERELVDRLFALVYADLRASAGALMRREPVSHTLRPTALVHEAYLRLVDARRVRWENRAHFFGAAARAMRQVLVDHARRKAARKRGGDHDRVAFDESLESSYNDGEDVLRIDAAIRELYELDHRVGRVADLHVFGGVPVEQVADMLGVSRRTAFGDWSIARKWLSRALT
jgi:RNA polymerase sigma factor (TIGR02999 family)